MTDKAAIENIEREQRKGGNCNPAEGQNSRLKKKAQADAACVFYPVSGLEVLKPEEICQVSLANGHRLLSTRPCSYDMKQPWT